MLLDKANGITYQVNGRVWLDNKKISHVISINSVTCEVVRKLPGWKLTTESLFGKVITVEFDDGTSFTRMRQSQAVIEQSFFPVPPNVESWILTDVDAGKVPPSPPIEYKPTQPMPKPPAKAKPKPIAIPEPRRLRRIILD